MEDINYCNECKRPCDNCPYKGSEINNEDDENEDSRDNIK